MINLASSNSVNHNYNLKIENEKQQSNSAIAKRIHDATRTPFQNLLKAVKHITLGLLKAPIALFRSAILTMRCKKSGSFLEKWSWKVILTHFHQVKVLFKPKKLLEIPAPKPLEKPLDDLVVGTKSSSLEITKLPFNEGKVKKDPDTRLENRAEKALAAFFKLGTDCMESTGKGVHGSQYVKSLKGKKIGVWKPIPDSAPIWNPFSQKAYLNPGPMAEAAAERASYLLAKELNNPFLNVPPVKIMEFNGKKGSFAVFEKGTPADTIIHEVDNKQSYSEQELYIFQIFVILDYLLGNLDRKLENWLIVWEDQTIKAIFPIDNSNTFPTEKPPSYNVNAAKNVYLWKDLNLANIPFIKPTRDSIKQGIIDENIQKILQKIDEDEQIQSCYPQGEKFLINESRKDFNLRVLKLVQLFLVNDKLTPKELAEF